MSPERRKQPPAERPEQWQVVEDSLKRSFQPPAMDELQRRVDAAAAAEAGRGAAASGRSRIGWVRPLLAIAAILVVTFVWPLRRKASMDEAGQEQPVISETARAELAARMGSGWNDFYREQRANRFRASSSCGAVLQAADFSEARPDGVVEFRPASGVALEGEMTTPHPETPRCLLLFVPHRKSFVFVYLLSRAADPHPVLPEDSELFLHRRELDHLVLYELSPLPEARTLEHFSLRTG